MKTCPTCGADSIPVYVLAGNYRQFEEWKLQDYSERREALYISDPNAVLGKRPGIVRRVGTWEDLPESLKVAAKTVEAGPSRRPEMLKEHPE